MRAFVAVNLSETEQQAVYDATAPLRDGGLPVKWVQPAGLHVTMKFLGEVADERATAIGAALDVAVATARPFEVALGGIGVFPTAARPRVIWLGVEVHPALELLANDIENALRPFGFEAELRPFSPHVTLGRARHGARSRAFGALPDLSAAVDYGSVVPVESVDVMESVLHPAGAEYRLHHRSPLGGRR